MVLTDEHLQTNVPGVHAAGDCAEAFDMCDAFRDFAEYQFMTGGQWVARPGGAIDFRVNIFKPQDPVMDGL